MTRTLRKRHQHNVLAPKPPEESPSTLQTHSQDESPSTHQIRSKPTQELWKMVMMDSHKQDVSVAPDGGVLRDVVVKVIRLPPDIQEGVRVDPQSLTELMPYYSSQGDHAEWLLGRDENRAGMARRTRSKTMQKAFKGLTPAAEPPKVLGPSQQPQRAISPTSRSAFSVDFTAEVKPNQQSVCETTVVTTKRHSVYEPTVVTPKRQSVCEPVDVRPKQYSVCEPSMVTPNRHSVRVPTEVKPKRYNVYEPTVVTPNQHSVRMPTEVKPKRYNVCESTVVTPFRHSVREPTEMKLKRYNVCEPTVVTPNQHSVHEPAEVKPKRYNVCEPTVVTPNRHSVHEPADVKPKRYNVCEPAVVTPNRHSVHEPTEVKPKRYNVCEPAVVTPKQHSACEPAVVTPNRHGVYEAILDDDELPDLDEPRCTCRSTCGKTVLMCQTCRLASYEPPSKMRKERHFLDVLSIHDNKHMRVNKYMNISDAESEISLEDVQPYPEANRPSPVVLDPQSSVITTDSDTEVEDNISTHSSAYDSDTEVEDNIHTQVYDSDTEVEDNIHTQASDSDTDMEDNINTQASAIYTHKPRTTRSTTRNVEPDLPTDSRLVTRTLGETPSYCDVPFHPVLLMAASHKVLKPCPVAKIAEPQLNIIRGVQEEAVACEGLGSHVVKLVIESTTTRYEPPVELIRELFTTMVESKDTVLCYSIYNTLETIFKVHPPYGTIPFTWSDLENIISKLRLPYGVDNIATHEAISNILGLRLIVSCLETDLQNRSLASQLRIIKCAAYKWVSTDLVFSHVKQLIQWITLTLRYGDFGDHLSTFKKLSLDSKKPYLHEDIPKVLPCLQKLLDLSITIAKRPDDSARRISIELVHMFRCLPSLQTRRLFLTTITSPLLKFALCQRLLEDQCGADSCGAQCLQDILQADFTAAPPRNSLTPPPTPSDDDDDDDNGGHRNRNPAAAYQDESWEELLLLLFTVVSSYLATAKAKLRYPLWKRVLDQPAEVLDSRDKKTLKNLPVYVVKLKNRVESNVTQMSVRTALYLLQLECLADLQ